MGRRDSNDKEWKAVKEKVLRRDEGDRILRVITPVEFLTLRKNAGFLMGALDPAHYLPVGQYPELCYDENNIVMLNRYSHQMLDSCKDPITGKRITKSDMMKWWARILKGNSSQYNYLNDKGLIEND